MFQTLFLRWPKSWQKIDILFYKKIIRKPTRKNRNTWIYCRLRVFLWEYFFQFSHCYGEWFKYVRKKCSWVVSRVTVEKTYKSMFWSVMIVFSESCIGFVQVLFMKVLVFVHVYSKYTWNGKKLEKHCIIDSRSQYHQHFTQAFLVQKYFEQLFSA